MLQKDKIKDAINSFSSVDKLLYDTNVSEELSLEQQAQACLKIEEKRINSKLGQDSVFTFELCDKNSNNLRKAKILSDMIEENQVYQNPLEVLFEKGETQGMYGCHLIESKEANRLKRKDVFAFGKDDSNDFQGKNICRTGFETVLPKYKEKCVKQFEQSLYEVAKEQKENLTPQDFNKFLGYLPISFEKAFRKSSGIGGEQKVEEMQKAFGLDSAATFSLSNRTVIDIEGVAKMKGMKDFVPALATEFSLGGMNVDKTVFAATSYTMPDASDLEISASRSGLELSDPDFKLHLQESRVFNFMVKTVYNNFLPASQLSSFFGQNVKSLLQEGIENIAIQLKNKMFAIGKNGKSGLIHNLLNGAVVNDSLIQIGKKLSTFSLDEFNDYLQNQFVKKISDSIINFSFDELRNWRLAFEVDEYNALSSVLEPFVLAPNNNIVYWTRIQRIDYVLGVLFGSYDIESLGSKSGITPSTRICFAFPYCSKQYNGLGQDLIILVNKEYIRMNIPVPMASFGVDTIQGGMVSMEYFLGRYGEPMLGDRTRIACIRF